MLNNLQQTNDADIGNIKVKKKYHSQIRSANKNYFYYNY